MINHNKTWAIDLVFLMLFLSIFFLLFVGGHQLISPDETRYTGIAWDMYKSGNYITPKLAGSPFLGKPILFYWWDILAYNIFGVSDFASRFFPAMIGALTCLMAYIFGRLVYNRLTGLLMALMLAAAPVYFGLTHYANMDSEVASWITCSMLSFLIAADFISKNKPATTWLYLSYFFAALAFLTKGLMGLLFPAMLIFFWVLLLNDWRLLLKIKLFSGLILFLVIIAPWMYLCEKENPGFLYYFFVYNQFYRFVGETFNNQKSFFYFWIIVIAGIFPFTIYILQAFGSHFKNFKSSMKTYRTEFFLMLWVFVITLFFSIPISKPFGYIAPALPAVTLLMAIYFARIWHKQPSKSNIISTWVLMVILVLVAITLFIIPLLDHHKSVINLVPYARFAAIVFLIAVGLIAFFLKKKKNFSYIISTLLGMMLLFNVNLIASLKTFNFQLNWPIAQKVLPYLKKYPKATVVMVGGYFYSMPMYLDREVPMVSDWDHLNLAKMPDNWQREIYEGVIDNIHDLPSTLMTSTEFKHLWNRSENKTIIVISNIPPGERFNAIIGNKNNNYSVIGTVPRRNVYIIINKHQGEKL